MAWLMLSSGARPAYLENVVRSLALFQGETLQVRYQQDLVSAEFKKQHEAGNLRHKTTYFAYVDTSGDNETPDLVIVREFRIEQCDLRGSSYVITLVALDYPRDTKNETIENEIRKRATEKLPFRKDGHLGGHWVSHLNTDDPKHPLDANFLVAHGGKSGSHLSAFEATANKLSKFKEFADDKRKLFVCLIDILDAKGGAFRPSSGKLKPGATYSLIVYHFYKDGGRSAQWKPFWLNIIGESRGLVFRSAQKAQVESEYDEKVFKFHVPRNFDAAFLGFDLSVTYQKPDGDEVTNVHFNFGVESRYFEKAVRFGFMTLGLIISQIAVLAAAGKLDWGYGSLVALGAAITAFAALSDYKKAV